MSDFLTRMARYSRGEADLIEPRLPGLFETPDDSGGAEVRVTAAARHDLSVETTVETGTGSVLEERGAVRQQEADRSNILSTNSLSDSPARKEPLLDFQEQRAAGTVQWQGIMQPDDEAELSESVNAKKRLVSAADRQERVPVNRQQSSEDPGKQAFSLKESDDFVTSRDSAEETATSLLVPHFIPDRTLESPNVAAAEKVIQQEVQEPAVHINIGRIEVRAQAVPPAPAVRRIREKSPTSLSLDAYLKGDGGTS